VQIPLLDPMALVPAMAYATTHLGFGVTCNLAYEAPFLFARRMATLDHLTGGPDRVEHRHRLPGQRRPRHGFRCADGHDDRYDLADEYLQGLCAVGG
jgi:long-chain alkane monooxygenase